MMKIVKVLIIGIIGAIVFDLIGIPIPWMLGPLVFNLIGQFFIKDLSMPKGLRNLGLIIVGYTIGSTFSYELFTGSALLWGFMIGINLLLIAFCFLLSYWVHKVGNVSWMTAVSCGIPGGLSQILAFAEDDKEVNLVAVTYFQVIRILTVIIFIPFLISGHFVQGIHVEWNVHDLPLLIVLFTGCGLSVMLGKKLRFPAYFIVLPILFVIFIQFTPIDVPSVPTDLNHIAQIFLGSYIGLLLKPHMLKLSKKLLLLGLGSAIILLIVTYGTSWILREALGMSFATSYLSTAPGGLDQMGLIASAVHAEVTVVVVFQLYRLLFIYFVIMPILYWVKGVKERGRIIEN